MIADVSSENNRTHALFAGERLVGEHALFRFAQQVRTVPARGFEVVPAEREPIAREQLGGLLVGHRGPLELHEQDLVVDRGAALLGARHQRAGCGIGGVDRELQPRVRPGASGQLADAGQLAHQLDHPDDVELGDPPAVRRQRVGTGLGVVEQRVDAFRAPAVDQRFEVPRHVGRGAVCFRDGGGHAPKLRGASPNASGSGSLCTTTRRRVARVSTT